jgi:EAL domain-containing protein (putative c-di-GMP-specific phosphodiesterase class I)
MVDDPNDAAIVRAIIQIAKTLNLKTIAKGVENESVLAALSLYQCDEAQGYHFLRPVPADEFSRFLLGMKNASRKNTVSSIATSR